MTYTTYSQLFPITAFLARLGLGGAGTCDVGRLEATRRSNSILLGVAWRSGEDWDRHILTQVRSNIVDWLVVTCVTYIFLIGKIGKTQSQLYCLFSQDVTLQHVALSVSMGENVVYF